MLAAARLPPLVCLSTHDPPAAAIPQRKLRAAGCTRYTHSAKAAAELARARRRTCCCALPLDSLLYSLTPLQQDLAAAAVAAIGARVCVKTCDRLAQDGVLDRVRAASVRANEAAAILYAEQPEVQVPGCCACFSRSVLSASPTLRSSPASWCT